MRPVLRYLLVLGLTLGAVAQSLKGEWHLVAERWSLSQKGGTAILTVTRGEQSYSWPIEIGSTANLKGVKVDGPTLAAQTKQAVERLKKSPAKPIAVNLAATSARPKGVVVAVNPYDSAQLFPAARQYGSFELKLTPKEVVKLGEKAFLARLKAHEQAQWKSLTAYLDKL